MRKIKDSGLILLIPGAIVVSIILGLLAKLGNPVAVDKVQQVLFLAMNNPTDAEILKVLKNTIIDATIVTITIAIVVTIVIVK